MVCMILINNIFKDIEIINDSENRIILHEFSKMVADIVMHKIGDQTKDLFHHYKSIIYASNSHYLGGRRSFHQL